MPTNNFVALLCSNNNNNGELVFFFVKVEIFSFLLRALFDSVTTLTHTWCERKSPQAHKKVLLMAG
jgi:hypothetical protein